MYDPSSQYEYERWTASRVDCSFTTTKIKECVVVAKNNNSGRSLGDFNEIA